MPHIRSKNVIDLAQLKISCQHCGARQLCFPYGLDESEVDCLDIIVKQNRPLNRGEHLFRTEDHFSCIYVVRSGAVKSYVTTESGEEQVTGFHLSGELLGLDGIYREYHACSAIALDTTTVCKLPMDLLEELARRVPPLQHHLLCLMSKEIHRDEEIMQLLSKKLADERLASLLCDLADRFVARGYAATEYQLPMSRTDIANYLGLALETVSRLFSRFQDEGLLSIDKKMITIHDLARLQKLAGMASQSDNTMSLHEKPPLRAQD